MKIDMGKLSTDIDIVALRWQTSGHIILAKSGEVVHQKHYGFADRDNKRKTKKDSRYVLSLQTPLLLGLATLRLMEQGQLG